MANIVFDVDNKTYTATLYENIHDHKRTCFCILKSKNPIKVFSGICVKNPNDGIKYDENFGFHLAFKRALFYQYVIEKISNELISEKKTTAKGLIHDWRGYFQRFRIPFGKALHQWYVPISEQ